MPVFIGDMVLYHYSVGHDYVAVVDAISTDYQTADLTILSPDFSGATGVSGKSRGTSTSEWQPLFRGVVLS